MVVACRGPNWILWIDVFASLFYRIHDKEMDTSTNYKVSCKDKDLTLGHLVSVDKSFFWWVSKKTINWFFIVWVTWRMWEWATCWNFRLASCVFISWWTTSAMCENLICKSLCLLCPQIMQIPITQGNWCLQSHRWN